MKIGVFLRIDSRESPRFALRIARPSKHRETWENWRTSHRPGNAKAVKLPWVNPTLLQLKSALLRVRSAKEIIIRTNLSLWHKTTMLFWHKMSMLTKNDSERSIFEKLWKIMLTNLFWGNLKNYEKLCLRKIVWIYLLLKIMNFTRHFWKLSLSFLDI